jgi:iron-sulfur cluster assembly protein
MIEFTEAALKQLTDAVEPTDYVRVGVGKGGCAGLSYTIEVAEEKKAGDVVVTLGTVKVCMDPYSSFILRETVVDYTQSLHQSGFKFLNSKATKSCACGTSFKPEEEPDNISEPAPVCLTAGCGS